MGLFDIFKKKKEGEKKKIKKEARKEIKKEVEKEPKKEAKKKLEKKAAPVKVEKKEEKIKPQAVRPKKKISEKGYKVLYSPHITEKATDFEKENKYVFRVWPQTNKIEVKKVIEETYGIDVIEVRIVNVPRRKVKLGRYEGWKKGYKKAIVKVKQGQKIEVLPR